MSADGLTNEFTFTNENLGFYLNELAKEYKKLVGKNMPAEIILIGGAAIVSCRADGLTLTLKKRPLTVKT